MNNKEKGAIFIVLGLILVNTSNLVNLSTFAHLIQVAYSLGFIIYGGIKFGEKNN